LPEGMAVTGAGRLVERAPADPDVLAVIFFGSRARGEVGGRSSSASRR